MRVPAEKESCRCHVSCLDTLPRYDPIPEWTSEILVWLRGLGLPISPLNRGSTIGGLHIMGSSEFQKPSLTI